MRIVYVTMLAIALLPAAAASGQTAADKAMARRISSHLEESGQLRNYRIGVTYQDGVATLSGTVASAKQREAAVRLAEQIAGVSRVDCRLQYPGETAPSRGDKPRSLAGAFHDAKLASAQGGAPGAMHAYGGNPPASVAPPGAAMRSPAATSHRTRPMPRGNMPLPMQHPGATGVRQASAHTYGPHGAPGAEHYAGPVMGGHGMGHHGAAMDVPVMPTGFVPHAHARGPSYESAHLPGYAWPSYAAYPNYAALTYPRQYSPTAWPYIGPFYPYPQVPLAWRKVSLEWDDGWWFLDFSAHRSTR